MTAATGCGLAVAVKEGPVGRHPKLAPHNVLGPDRLAKLFGGCRLEAARRGMSDLGDGFGSFDFALDLVLGGRADHNGQRHFRGKLALVNVFDTSLSATQAQCLFRAGDAAPMAYVELVDREVNTSAE